MPAPIDPMFLPGGIVKADISTDDQGVAFIRWWPKEPMADELGDALPEEEGYFNRDVPAAVLQGIAGMPWCPECGSYEIKTRTIEKMEGLQVPQRECKCGFCWLDHEAEDIETQAVMAERTKHLVEARKRIKKLEAALKPFAEAVSLYDVTGSERLADDVPLVHEEPRLGLQISHLRAARKALEG